MLKATSTASIECIPHQSRHKRNRGQQEAIWQCQDGRISTADVDVLVVSERISEGRKWLDTKLPRLYSTQWVGWDI